MKILLVGLAEDPQLALHARFLLDAGHRVHLANLSTDPAPPRLDSRLRVHAVAGARRTATLAVNPKSSRPSTRQDLLIRMRLALARSSSSAAHAARRTGLDVDLGRLTLAPPLWLDADTTLNPLALACKLWPEVEVPWLRNLIERVRPDVINAFGLVPAGGLLVVMKRRAPDLGGHWLLTLGESDLAAVQDDPVLAEGLGLAMREIVGLLVDHHGALETARDYGFQGDLVAIAPIWGGWSETSRSMRQDGPTSSRRVMLVHGAAGVGGRPFVALRAAELAAESLREYQIVVVTPDEGVDVAARLLAVRSGLNVAIDTSTHDSDLLRAHGRARCSIILNTGAGADPAVQMARFMGSFPIVPSGSSGAEGDDSVRNFLTGLQVDPDHPDAVAAALRCALGDDALVDTAAARNQTLAVPRLSRETAGEQVLDLYRQARG
jgi:hypothetical protein